MKLFKCCSCVPIDPWFRICFCVRRNAARGNTCPLRRSSDNGRNFACGFRVVMIPWIERSLGEQLFRHGDEERSVVRKKSMTVLSMKGNEVHNLPITEHYSPIIRSHFPPPFLKWLGRREGQYGIAYSVCVSIVYVFQRFFV